MKAITLSFHDAVADANFAASGFTEQGANTYKLDVKDMEQHFDAVAALSPRPPGSARVLLDGPPEHSPLFFAFDDGGSSAFDYIAPLLDKLGWVGHFFITGNRIDTPGFVTREQIKALDAHGHVVGSHSWTHPTRMAKCTRAQLNDEWQKSVDKLSTILGKQVDIASVPGGYYSPEVARSASACGVRVLFTSEPVKTIHSVDDCLVLGRYTLLRGMPAAVSQGLASEQTSPAQIKQYVLWNSKKVVKAVAGGPYLALRKRILKNRERSGLSDL